MQLFIIHMITLIILQCVYVGVLVTVFKYLKNAR